MHATTTTPFLPAAYEPDLPELAPPTAPDVFDELTGYVAGEVAGGRAVFDVLGDPFVLERADEYVSVLDHLARQPAVRAALAVRRRGEPTHAYTLAA